MLKLNIYFSLCEFSKKFYLLLMLRQFLKKKWFVSAGVIGILSSQYCYKKHMYEKELFDRYNDLVLEKKVKLSGISVQQRQAFPMLWYIQWLLPYHQSLKFRNPDGTVRQVGLGRSPEKKTFWDL